jgi:CheY-like chemotaxis protein
MESKLIVESRPGSGSCFSFDVRLPELAVDLKDSSGATRVITGYTGPRHSVLIVDDVPVNRHVLRELLQPLGFELFEAASGETALAMAQADLTFLDLRMPAGMDGLELARRLRAQPGGDRVKLIAMSASVLSFTRNDALAAGCDDFLPKPFREIDLLTKIGEALKLDWIYADPVTPRRDSRQPFAEISSELPGAVLDELLGCARRGEIVALRERLAALRTQRANPDSLLDALDAMARSYRMEQIRDLLERQLAARPPPA